MFQRLILHGSAALFTIAAFSFAFFIFIGVAWRALRMRRPDLDHFANLPFETATPASRHEPKPESPAE
jgi:hypothetical protein